jgi:hypothetical protein
MVCRPNKPTKACTNAAKAIYMAARSSKSSEAVGVDGAPAGDAAGHRPLLAPLVMWGRVFISVRSSYTTPLNSSLGAAVSI